MKVGVIDLNLCNVQSIMNVLNRLDCDVALVSAPHELSAVSHVIFPGVGAFDETMSRLDSCGLYRVLKNELENSNLPFLGICIGMQILFEGSAEGKLAGFGLLPGRCQRLDVSNIGWSSLDFADSPLLRLNRSNDRFFFIHNFFIPNYSAAGFVSRCRGNNKITSSVSLDAIHGVQFHPEKSFGAGLQVFRSFLEMY